MKNYKNDNKNYKLDIAKKIRNQFNICSIYGQIHIKNGSLYKPLPQNVVTKLVLESCLEYLPNNKISKNTINDIIFYLNSLEVIPEENINPENSFSFKNGELVINNGIVSFKDHHNVFTFQSNLQYNHSASTKEINNFLDDILSSENDKKQILESLAVGMFPTLRHQVNFDSFIVAYGTGANGKSVLFESIIKPIFSAGAMSSIPIEMMNKRFFLANLLGKRINIATENSSHYIGENRQVKALTSGDTQIIEKKHLQPFEANIFCSLFFSINKEPCLGELTYAMKRRLRIINFPYRFTDKPKENEKKADSSLKDPNNEKTKILQQGLIILIKNTAERLWQDKIMTPNDQNIISELQEINSHHRQFISKCLLFDPHSEIESSILYQEYINFCEKEYIAEFSKTGSIKWSDPSQHDRASRSAIQLTKKLFDLYPSQLSKKRTSDKRLIKGIKLKSHNSSLSQ